MQYPTMNRNASRAVSVPAMTGGVNLSDPLNLVDDNQMTDMKNLWYKDGTLQTRPAIKAKGSFGEEEVLVTGGVTMYSTNLSQFIDGEKYTLFVKTIKESETGTNGTIEIIAAGKNGALFTVSFLSSDVNIPVIVYSGKPVLENGIGIFILISRVSSYTGKSISYLHEVIKSTSGNYNVVLFTPDDYYAPCILINGKGNSYSSLPVNETTQYAPASMFEGYNTFYMAGSKFCFVTDGVSKTFTVPKDLYMTELRVSYTDPEKGNVYNTNWLSLTNLLGTNSDTLGDSGYTVSVFLGGKSSRNITVKKTEGDTPLPSSLGKIANNLVFEIRDLYKPTVSVDHSQYNSQSKYIEKNRPASLLDGMTQAVWFGGSSDGISGGTRLFLAGSNKNKNLMVWSDVNNPTYFPENNYAYIGEASQKITALAKQSDMLVIFKENELFYTVYTQGDSYTADDVVSGNVVDVAAQAAIFPMVQIHSEIGCDIPKSVQLCGDRLVWACKDRHVYMLKSSNQYSTCNISPISDMCDRALSNVTDDEIADAKSCIYDGHYLLALGSKVFVLNYDYYYFKNLPAYSDGQKAQRKMIWYLWEFPQNQGNLFSEFISSGDQCHIVSAYKYYPASGSPAYTEYRLFELTNDSDSDQYLKQLGSINSGDFIGLSVCSAPIESMMQTKMFDFGMIDRFKKIEQLYIGVGETAGKTRISYVTDRGILDGGSFEISGNGDDYSPDYVTVKRFLPMVNRALRFGIRLECDGRIAIDGITIKYKPMGVVR